MKKIISLFLSVIMILSLCACGSTADTVSDNSTADTASENSTTVVTDSAAASDNDSKSFSSDAGEEHALTADGEELSYDGISVNKTGDSDGDESDFYGTNAAVFATNGAALTIKNATITTKGSHANAVFSYGENTVINISGSVINTSENNSGGIMVTGGGTLNAQDCEITTLGGSSAAIRSDRGGGTMTVDGGNYESFGAGSPAIYSTADITVSSATLYSDVSQAVVVEGKNSVILNDCDATGQNTVQNSDNSDRFQAVMVYQSMSGDASQGEGSFEMNGGSLTSLNGGMFFVTNTVATISLNNVALKYASDDLLRVEAAGWGNEGSNGGQLNFYADSQSLEGIITVDDVSKLNLYLDSGSTFTGSFTGNGQIFVSLANGSKWTLTDNCSIASLSCDADAIDLNGYTLTVNGEEYTEGTACEGSAVEFDYSAFSGGEMPTDGEMPPDGQMPQDGEGGMGPGGDGSAPPDMNDGNNPGNQGPAPGSDGTEPPEKPDGETGSGSPPEKPQ